MVPVEGDWPVLQLRDIALVPVARDDLPLLFKWINDRDLVLLNAPYRPVAELRHESWFEDMLKRDDVHLFGIRHLESGRLIGSCQLLGVHAIHRHAELQVRIGDPDARGRGYGTQAVELLVRFGFVDLHLHRISLHVFADNVVAIRTYEKVGFRREGVSRDAAFIDGRYVDVVTMGILSTDVQPPATPGTPST
jgi:RimJ/RimL family protein N-acetyltransferase